MAHGVWSLGLALLALLAIAGTSAVTGEPYLTSWFTWIGSPAAQPKAFVLLAVAAAALTVFSRFPLAFLLLGAIEATGWAFLLERDGRALAEMDLARIGLSSLVPFTLIQILAAGLRIAWHRSSRHIE